MKSLADAMVFTTGRFGMTAAALANLPNDNMAMFFGMGQTQFDGYEVISQHLSQHECRLQHFAYQHPNYGLSSHVQ